MGFLPADFTPGVALWHHFFPSCHLDDWNSSIFSSVQGSPVTAIAALTLQRAPWERYQGTQGCKCLCFHCSWCCRHCWGLWVAGLCWAPSRLQVPKLGESSSCPGPHSFHTLFPLYIGILAISGLKFLKSTQGSYKQFRMLRGGGWKNFGMLRRTGNPFGCSEGLQAFWDAQFQGILFWKRMCSGLPEAWVLLLGIKSLQTVESLDFFVGSLKGVSRWASRRLI